MRYVWIAGLAMIAGVAAQAQLTNPATVDPVALANAVSAASPPPCPVPSPDTLTGTAGVLAPCMTRPDAARPTQVQPVSTLTNGDGSFSATWPTPFSAVPTVATADAYGGVPPYICSVTTKTATTVSGKCYQVVSTTLPTATTALFGLVVSPVANPGSGVTVMIVGRL